MRLQARTWLFISLLLFAAAAVVWHFGNERRDLEKPTPVVLSTNQHAATLPAVKAFPLLTRGATNLASSAKTNSAAAVDKRLVYRLSNTDRQLAELMYRDAALLLQNALIDTASGVPLKIPEALRASPDHGTYLVQSRGAVTDKFRAQIRDAGGSIVSYIPNNAYMVRVDAAGAKQLAALPQTQSVTTYEPYFKLDQRLLPLAVENKEVDGWLKVTSYPGLRDALASALLDLGAEIKGETRTPFGPQIVIESPRDSLTKIARLPAVQLVEKYSPNAPVNDRSRVRVGVNTNSMIGMPQHLNLSGQGVLVNLNDTGVDETHPALAGRIFYNTAFAPTAPLRDTNGHGTHVAGTIASGSSDGLLNVSSNNPVPGSVTNADFHGMAPLANIYWQPIPLSLGNPLLFPETVQEGAAKTNALISNNSWGSVFNQSYDSTAASFDAAVRDSLPGVTGEQPVMFVFAAGNSGFGDENGLNAISDTISSPATAKNVITVGAIESMRNITNSVTNFTSTVDTNGNPVIRTNRFPAFLGPTDSDDQVASFSSRGNVGVGIEGPNGRFKPDVVAPGSFTISTRSQQSTFNTNGSFIVPDTRTIPGQQVFPGNLNQYQAVVPAGAVRMNILITRNANSPSPFPSLPIYYNFVTPTTPPTTNDLAGQGFLLAIPVNTLVGSTVGFAVGNDTAQPVSYDIVIIFEISVPGGGYNPAFANLNTNLAPWYRYDSGTSMAAPVVTGLAALIQEFLSTRTSLINPSPALKKAILINGARGVSPFYNIQMDGFVNDEGWGLVNLTNSLPLALQGGYTPGSSPVLFLDQDLANSLVTGESRTWDLSVTASGQTAPLHITLVWTDPPGNPAASIKLVNDLDLIVSNNVTHEIFVGNAVGGPSGASFAVATNALPVYDIVNNVENVILGEDGQPLSASYSITVRARHVNVNSRPDFFDGTGGGNPDDVVQDFALVISSGSTNPAAPFALSGASSSFDLTPFVQGVTNISPTNASPLLAQRVGANAPLLASVTTNGVAVQWSFYIVTNTVPGGNNIAFTTFFPPNLSRTRASMADVDLFVSTDSTITNLNPGAINGARRSVQRGGNELVVLTNSSMGSVYYVGVRSEDQQGSEFGFFALASDQPFSTRDTNGNLIVTARQVDVPIPDGTPGSPQGAMIFAFAFDDGLPGDIRRLIATNVLSHELMGDLQGVLRSPRGTEVVLNNHNFVGGDFAGQRTIVYEDSMEGDQTNVVAPAIVTQSTGPGSLNDYIGESAFGTWQFTMIDNQTPHLGTNNAFSFRVEPALATNQDRTNITLCIQNVRYDVIDVPVAVTNLTLVVSNLVGGPVEVYMRRGARPVVGNFNLDKGAVISPAQGRLSIGLNDQPPISPGRYFIAIYNPNPQCVTLDYNLTYELGPKQSSRFNYYSTNNTTLIDDAVTNASVQVNVNREIVDVEVGIRVDHERISDLVFHLVSPQGTRVMLMENRGGTDASGTGYGYPITNVFPQFSTGSFLPDTKVINTGTVSGTVVIDYDFFAIPDRMTIYYDGVRISDTGYINGAGQFSVDFGPGAGTALAIIMNEGTNSNTGTVWQYIATVIQPSHKMVFTDDTNRTTVPIKFVTPPFVPPANGCPSNIVVLNEDFETYPRIGYNSGYMGGWHVDRPGVELHWTGLFGSTAYSGSNYLDMNESTPGLISTNLDLVPGTAYALNYAFARNPDSRTVFGYVPQTQIRLGGAVLTNVIANQINTWGNLGWMNTSIVFVATSSQMLLEFDSQTPPQPAGVLFDSISVVALCTNSPHLYVQPEEPLSVLRGQSTLGTWKLEVWDNRLGAPLGLLVDWYVSFLYANQAAVGPVPVPTPSIAATSLSSTNPEPHALLTWPTYPGKLYRIEYTGNFSNWQTLTNITATSDLHRVTDPSSMKATSNRFYRLVPVP